MNSITHLIYGDGHSAPHQDLSRYSDLGRYIAKTMPDVIVNLGDHVTFDSCSFFKVLNEYRTTAREDIDAATKAFDLLEAPIKALQKKQRRDKHKVYDPVTAFLEGNHEDRLNRRMQDDEEVLGSLVTLNGLLDIDERFDLYCAYREYLIIDGIAYTHCPVNARRQPITGVNRGRAIAMQSRYPVVYGHTHKADFSTIAWLGNGNDLNWSLNISMFADQNHVEAYATDGTTGWTYGVTELKIYEDGTVVHKQISMQELKEC